MSPRRSLALVTPLAGLLAASAMAGSASAATTQTLGCRASVARVTALAAVAVEPYVANPTGGACATDSAGVSTATPLGIGALGGTLTIGPANATTTSTATSTALGASSLVSVNAVSIPTAAGAVSIVGPAQTSASYACVNGVVDAASRSTLTAIQIGSQQIMLPGGEAYTAPLTTVLGQIGTVSVNQNTSTATSNTETLLTVTLNGVATIVVGEAAVTQPASGACSGLTPTPNPNPSPNPTPNPNPSPNPTPNPNPSPNPTPTTCPAGTTLDASGTVCDLDGAGGTTTGVVVAAASSDDIIGGRVISLATARRLYGAHTACLNGAGPKFVVVGTQAANRITVRRMRLRVLGLGGNDTITVKGGNRTCVNGGAGNDTVTNTQSNRVTVFGANGNDRITIGNGPAYVLGGSGTDRIVAGNGKVNLQGNAGADYIKAGNGADTLNGGSGNDVLIAGTGRSHLNGGPGNNRMTARGKVAFVKAGKGHSVAYVQRADMSYARHHGVSLVHAI